MKQRWFRVLALLITVCLFFLGVAFGVDAGATDEGGGNVRPLFTDNVAATSPHLDMTPMEQALVDLLGRAEVSIDVAAYDFNRARIRDAIIAAHQRGVNVRIVTDNEARASYSDYTLMAAAGIPVVDDGRSSIMHNKFVVVDGLVVWTGSTNLTNTGFTLNHENSLVITSTVLAEIYTIEFEEMFVYGLFGTAKTDNTPHLVDVDGIPIEVYFSPSDGAIDEVIAEIGLAQETIRFAVFFATDDGVRDALIAAHQRGVDVRGVWDQLGAANAYSDDEALCAAGIPIKIESFPGKVHNKFMTIDDQIVVTGSMNWTGAGGNANDENTLIIHDSLSALAYQEAFVELYAALGPETLCAGGGTAVYLPIILDTADFSPPPAAAVVITTIFFDGAGSQEPDEYVEIQNQGTQPVHLAGWTLRDMAAHVFTFPDFVMQGGQICRVYTNENHPEWCGFNYASGSPVWNNGGDCAEIRNNWGEVVGSYCYP